MKKAFTLVELLVVIAIIAILAAMLMPMLGRARQEGLKATCKSNVHSAGLAFGMFLTDNDGLYPAWASDYISIEYKGGDPYIGCGTTPNNWYDLGKIHAAPTGGGPFYQLIEKGYMDGPDILDCPGKANFEYPYDDRCGKPTVIGPIDSANGYNELVYHNKWVGFNEYGYDIGSVSKKSVAQRVYFGDQWKTTYEDDTLLLAYWPYSHPGGSNVLHIDGAVTWAAVAEEVAPETDPWWIAIPPWYVPRCYIIQNPRMDEDVHCDKITHHSGGDWPDEYGTGTVESVPPESFMHPLDLDDIYYVENWPSGRSRHGDPAASTSGNDRITQAWMIQGGGVPRRGWGRWAADGGTPLGHDTRQNGDEPGRSVWEREFRAYNLIMDGFAYNHNRGAWPHYGYGGHMCYFPEEHEFASEARWRPNDCRLIPMGGYRAYGLQYNSGTVRTNWRTLFRINPY